MDVLFALEHPLHSSEMRESNKSNKVCKCYTHYWGQWTYSGWARDSDCGLGHQHISEEQARSVYININWKLLGQERGAPKAAAIKWAKCVQVCGKMLFLGNWSVWLKASNECKESWGSHFHQREEIIQQYWPWVTQVLPFAWKRSHGDCILEHSRGPAIF